MMIRLVGLFLVAGAVVVLWYLPRYPGETPFSMRYRDLIESYLSVVIAAMITVGLVFAVGGSSIVSTP
jgi:hypothetical protein